MARPSIQYSLPWGPESSQEGTVYEWSPRQRQPCGEAYYLAASNSLRNMASSEGSSTPTVLVVPVYYTESLPAPEACQLRLQIPRNPFHDLGDSQETAMQKSLATNRKGRQDNLQFVLTIEATVQLMMKRCSCVLTES
jgi:hypothetical protein